MMGFTQAGRAENPDLAWATNEQEAQANALRASETQADAQNKQSLLTGGAMLAQAAPAGTLMSAATPAVAAAPAIAATATSAAVPAVAGAAATGAAMTPVGWGALAALGLGSMFL